MVARTFVRRGRWKMPWRDSKRMFAEEVRMGEFKGDYANWLIKHLGRPMERALIKARHRFDRANPARVRSSRLHAAYARKRR